MEEEPQRGGAAPRTILLVENELMIALEMEGIIKESGLCEVIIAGSQAAAREVLAEARCIAGAILDVSVGDGTTLGLARELTAEGVPIAFATGYDTSVKLLAPFPEVPVINKPFDSAELVAVVAKLLAAKDRGSGIK